MAEWTDERMDDLATQMAAGFERTDRAIGDLRGEIVSLRRDVKTDIDGLRSEVAAGFESMHAMMYRSCFVMVACLTALAAALIGVLAAGSGAG